jgi:Tol biopolymer transport system component
MYSLKTFLILFIVLISIFFLIESITSSVNSDNNLNVKNERNFDLFSINIDGTKMKRITFFDGFDGFPMFSPDGKHLVFASNRNQLKKGDTNLFIAEWKKQ